MKSFLLLLPLLSALALAEECQCPQVKCPADDAVKLCNCINGRETMCVERCPDYKPTYLPCPASPLPTASVPCATATPSPPKCVCDRILCPMIWPLSCHCANGVAQACYDKCGGAPPVLQVCDRPTAISTLLTLTLAPPSSPTKTPLPWKPTTTKKPIPTKPTSTAKPVPTPTGAHAICGGGRGSNIQCELGFLCMKDPFKPGCGPECDGPGICVEDKMCGGFAGFGCKETGQTCVDDPRDDCDPKRGGADCGGLCVWAS
ncbi:hypothetical protein K505DRAFT_259560 [Melanomma pulvis-pyrius CBS 109.77]|uniref:Uncharacterized protein n=1 Tax=Melanomma pulvis-pyrius CBS 109.77 TaxID=1314802 RepID=A0A6A6WRK1_9PLEO|nr:hypothetical protein K505DRAFT_259560 [Melanomma pulvis-pyrius CBS 109.77]